MVGVGGPRGSARLCPVPRLGAREPVAVAFQRPFRALIRSDGMPLEDSGLLRAWSSLRGVNPTPSTVGVAHGAQVRQQRDTRPA